MSADQREESAFEEALRLPANQRVAYLNCACGGDVEMRQRLERLLSAFERAGGFMKDPAAPEERLRFSPELAERPGDYVDRYKLLEKIGEGGCGVVYVAEQETPVRRRVALKLIKLSYPCRGKLFYTTCERSLKM